MSGAQLFIVYHGFPSRDDWATCLRVRHPPFLLSHVSEARHGPPPDLSVRCGPPALILPLVLCR
jgi:hypothetical protein